MSSVKSSYIDLSKTQFTITPDGQYCYTIDATSVNNKPVQGHECWTISSDTFSDRVNCMCDAINNAYYGYKTSIGAADITASEKQLIYNDIVRQYLPFIKQWQLCDGVKFINARDNYLNSRGYKDKAMFELMSTQSTLIQNALDANQCSGSVVLGMSPFQKWFWIIIAIIVGILIIWFLWRRFGSKSSSSSSSTGSHSRSISNNTLRRASSARR